MVYFILKRSFEYSKNRQHLINAPMSAYFDGCGYYSIASIIGVNTVSVFDSEFWHSFATMYRPFLLEVANFDL